MMAEVCEFVQQLGAGRGKLLESGAEEFDAGLVAISGGYLEYRHDTIEESILAHVLQFAVRPVCEVYAQWVEHEPRLRLKALDSSVDLFAGRVCDHHLQEEQRYEACA